LFGGDKGLANAAGQGYDGEVLAGALDLGFAELVRLLLACCYLRISMLQKAYRNDKVVLESLLAHWEGLTVEQSVSMLVDHANTSRF
jgi:hypothetical protein